jgi:hypothetical protein
MDARTRSRALRAAAHVAFAVTAIACGGSVATEDATDAGGSDALGRDTGTADSSLDTVDSSLDTADSSLDTDDAVANPDAPTCNYHWPTPLDDATFECCVALDEAVFAADAGVSTEADDCCDGIITRTDKEWDNLQVQQWSIDDKKAGSVMLPCCLLLNNPVGRSCTPWGPPAPPEMPEEIA